MRSIKKNVSHSIFLMLVALIALGLSACSIELDPNEEDQGKKTELDKVLLSATEAKAGESVTVDIFVRKYADQNWVDNQLYVNFLKTDGSGTSGGSGTVPMSGHGVYKGGINVSSSLTSGDYYPEVSFGNSGSRFYQATPGDTLYTHSWQWNYKDNLEGTNINIPTVRLDYSGGPITVDGPEITGYIEQSGQMAVYTFEATQGTTYTAKVTATQGSGTVSVCDSADCVNGNLGGGSATFYSNGPGVVTFDAAFSGTHYVVLYAGGYTDYTVSVKTGGGATALTIGTALGSQSLATGETKKYSFTPTSAVDHNVFIYNRSDVTPTWVISRPGSTKYDSGKISFTVAGTSLTVGQAYAFDLSIYNGSMTSFDMIAVSGSGSDGTAGLPVAITTGAKRLFQITSSINNIGGYYSFVANATSHTIRVTPTNTGNQINMRLYSVGDYLVGNLMNWSASCWPNTTLNYTECTTGTLTPSNTYYLRLDDYNGLSDDSWGEVTITGIP